MARDPKFGVEKDSTELTTQDPSSVLYGVTSNDKFIPIKIDNTGRLEIGTGVTLAVSDLQIGAVEIKNATTDDRVFVSTDQELRTEARLHDGIGTPITSTLSGIRQGIDVNVVGGATFGVSDNEDDSVAAGQFVPLFIGLTYGFDGIDWGRVNQTGGRQHVKADLLNTTDNILVYGRTITGSPANVPLPLEIDDSVHPGGLTTVLTSNLLYSFDSGAGTWKRTNQTSGSLDVDVKASVLPTGAATEATLSAIDTSLDVSLSTRASEATVATLLTEATFTAEDFATQTTLATLLLDATFTSRINTLGQKASAASTPVVLASDQSAIPISVIFPASQTVDQATHDNLNLNANLQVGDIDVSVSNQVPVDSDNIHVVDSGGDTYVAGTTEGSLAIGRVIDVDALPTLTIGQISGLTLDINGALRVTEGNPDAIENPQNASENDQAFSAEIISFNLGTAGTETPVLLLRNPLASTVTLYLNTLSVNNDVKTQSARIIIYKSPTVSATGTPITPSNFKVGSIVVSQITPFSGPTISANGTQLATFGTGADQNDLRRTFDFAIIVPPNTDLLLTGTGSNNNTLIALGVEWAEA